MHTNVNLAAPIGVMMLLGTGLIVALIAMALVYSLVTKKFFLTRLTFFMLLVIGVVYMTAMFIFSLSSKNEVLALGQEKHFYEIDCHLAYSIADVVKTKTLGSPPNAIAAAGTFYVITVKTRFDETTISARRGNGELHPNPRVVTLLDVDGSRYGPSIEGQQALARSDRLGTPITTPLRPGETYSTTFVFDLPPSIDHPILLVNEGDWITRLIIGHENSLAHKKTSFQI